MGDPPERAPAVGYGALVADAAPALLRLAVMLTGSREDGEDLLQSALLRVARHGERIAAMDAPRAYLRTVVVHEHATRGRRRAHRTTRWRSGCLAQATLLVDGTVTAPTLDPGQDFTRVVDGYLR